MGHTTTEDDLGANALFGTGHYFMATWCALQIVHHKSRPNMGQFFLEIMDMFENNRDQDLFVCGWDMAWYEATAKEYPIISKVYLNLQE